MDRDDQDYISVFSTTTTAYSAISINLIKTCSTQQQDAYSQPLYILIALHIISGGNDVIYLHTASDHRSVNEDNGNLDVGKFLYLFGYCLS
jgi:hypothetical protein